jgi:hypothetical protein
MPINKDLNVDPYFDDFDLAKQYYRVLFKPSYAVQARELTQIQSILQNQIEQFGDNIFKEGSIIRGCNFTELNDLNYVKVRDKSAFDVLSYVGFTDTVNVGGIDYDRDNTFELRGTISGVTAQVVAATRGFETRNPDLNTFYINYTNTSSGNKVFQAGELLEIYKISTVEIGTSINRTEEQVESINVTTFSGAIGNSFGLRSAPGIIFQKGHFLFAEEQLVIIAKYTNVPDNVSVGYTVEERVVTAFQDPSLYDNANGSFNENAPGADRLKLIPVLTVIPTPQADADTRFFTLTRYSNGNAIFVRDVSQYNALGEEMARRTYEESGDYVVRDFATKVVRKNGDLKASVGSGLAYVKGYRVENLGELLLSVDDIANTAFSERTNQAVSFNYGGYLNILDTTVGGVVPIANNSTVTLKDEANTAAGTARVRNLTDDKIFLYDLRFTGSNTIRDIEKIEGSSGSIRVANNSVMQEVGSASMIFDTGMIGLRSIDNISLPVRDVRTLSGLSGNTVTLTPGIDEDFNLSNDDIYFVDSTNTKIEVTNAVLSGSNLVVSLAQNPAANATIYFNKRVQNASPFTKIDAELFVKCTFSANTDLGTKYNLGFPDVYEIVSITDSANNDVTSSFRLKTNQRDNYYDRSYIELVPSRPLPTDGDLLVKMKAFKLNDTTGEYFFTIDSYPATFPRNKIPQYTTSNGTVYDLRDCLDFRPYVEPLSPANYTNAAVEATAPAVSDVTTGVNVAPSFSSSYTILTPAHNQFAQLDYEYFLNRTDSVVVDSYGRISVIRGNEAERSLAPIPTGDQLKVADIFIPGVGALTPEEATIQNRPRYGIRVTQRGTRSYKMKDIEELEKKVDNLRYYVLLSALEAETKNLNILDENGLSRFKNGIIVDPFNDLNIADLENPEYNAAIDFTEKSLMPAVKTFPLNLKYKSSTASTQFPSTNNAKVATLQRNTDVAIISQPYATEFRNCVSNFYSYRGIGALSPEYDGAYDVTTNPVNINIDLATPLRQLVDGIQEFIPLTSTRTSLLNTARNVSPGVVTRTQTFRDTTRSLQVTGQQTNESFVGDFVTNFDFNPFMRAREVRVYMTGLRPNTRHYFFFDGDDVNQYIIPGTPVNDPDLIRRNGTSGASVFSDANGVVRAIFRIPPATFFVGDRRLEIADVDVYDTIGTASTSYGFVTYRAYNFSVEKSSLTISTRVPEARVVRTSTDRNVTRRIFIPQVSDEGERDIGKDPIAQTFFIKSGMGRGSDTVFVSKIDLFFKRKSTTNGVTVEIREVLNGYPSYDVVPFSRVHLTSPEVNTSDDASLVTTVTFNTPVRLDTEKEYAFVVIPDAADPDYLIFTSKVGGTNITPGENRGLPIVQDWGDGVLFTSTNNRAWKSYQDEDIKFTLYRHNFNASTGSVTLMNDDHEFLTISNSIGRFEAGEIVYKLETRDGSTSNTVSVTAGNNQITGTNLSATYASGDFVLLDDGSSNRQIVQVASANSTVIIADRPASFTDALDASPVTVGTLVHYDFRYPDFVVLEASSATATRKFAATNQILGFDSGATATVDTVDDVSFSYIQPMIVRTNDSVTGTSLSGTFADPNNPSNTYTIPMQFSDKTTFGGIGMVVYSKSNDTDREKTIDLTVSMSNANNVTSTPFVDLETAMVLAYQWKVSEDSFTTSKYVSKIVELTENFDAEDFQVFVTAYRPLGTDIRVYIKPQAADDSAAFDSNAWVELELFQGTNRYTSESNIYDFREYGYRVAESDKTFGVLSYTNSTGSYEGYRRFAVKIELRSENIFKAPRLLDYRGIALT